MTISVERQNRLLILLVLLINIAGDVYLVSGRRSLSATVQERSQVMQSIGKYADHIRELNDERWDILMRRMDDINVKLAQHLEAQEK